MHKLGVALLRANTRVPDHPQSDTPSRCYGCFRPVNLCFCDAIPNVKNRTAVLLLQHRRERFHPFNTARIVNQALDRCHMIVGHNEDLSKRLDAMTLSQETGILYPGEDSQLLTEIPPQEYPTQLIIPDGTWHQTKTLIRDVPRLQMLRQYRLAPTSPSRYRIRREPDSHGLSTLEATVAALQSIEPETKGLDQLIGVLDRMATEQVKHGTSNWRQNKRRRRGMPNIPRALSGDLSQIVVAYGEQERGGRRDQSAERNRKPMPIFWTAIRMISGERFQCAIRSDSLRDKDFMQQLRLSPQETLDAVSLETFRQRWKSFLRPQDQVAVFHPSTAKLLDTVHAQPTETLILKSIDIKSRDGHSEADREKLTIAPSENDTSRASQRLANAVAYVNFLNKHFQTT